jgi:hypothetical protein
VSEHSDLQRTILDYLNWLPMTYAFPTHGPKHKPICPGVADIICCHRGNFIAIEVKAGADKVRSEQKEFCAGIDRGGGLWFIASSLTDVVCKIPGGKK